MFDLSFCIRCFIFINIFKHSKCEKCACLFDILFVVSPIKKFKDSFVKVESYCLVVPVSEDFQHIKDSYLICLLLWCYAMFNFCPSVHNAPNGQHRMPNIRNTIECIDMIAALENSSMLFTSTCKVLIQTEFNGILHKCLLQDHLKCLWKKFVWRLSIPRWFCRCVPNLVPIGPVVWQLPKTFELVTPYPPPRNATLGYWGATCI